MSSSQRAKEEVVEYTNLIDKLHQTLRARGYEDSTVRDAYQVLSRLRDEAVKRITSQMVSVTFYKSTGKFYAQCEIDMETLYLSQSGYKQEIVNKQTALNDGWQDRDYIVVTSANQDPHYIGFHEQVWTIGSFRGLKKEVK